MSFRFVRHAVGKMLQILGLLLLLPLAIAVRECAPLPLPEALADPRAAGLLIAALASLVAGTFLVLLPRGRLRGNGVREGFAIVTFGWLVLTFFGCIPLWLHFMGGGGSAEAYGVLRCFTDAYF